MMKPIRTFLPIGLALICCAALCWQCKPNNSKQNVAPEALTATAVPLLTHKEAADTLRSDTTAPIKPSIFRLLSDNERITQLASLRLDSLFILDYPDNGFYGDDRYRIEFVFTEAIRDAKDPSIYHVKGKNRFKKTISTFAGTFQFNKLEQFFDPNIDPENIQDMEIKKMYAASGRFDLKEDSTMATSGSFVGDFTMDYGLMANNQTQLWFFTNDTPAKGSGYRFDGKWISYKKADLQKPVLWSRDLFRFANDILQDFSYGEREIEINPKYRNLGWDNFWDGEEWWHDSPKEKL
jgi:hypothetical protein